MRFLALSALFSLSVFACSPRKADIKPGTWRGVIEIQDHQLPFTFEVTKEGEAYKAYLQNAGEKILLDEINITGDTIDMVLHIFDASLRAKVDGDKMTGTFVKNYAPQLNMPFSATFGDDFRFVKTSAEPVEDYSGKYQILFTAPKEKYESVGVFEQQGNHLTGTFLAPNGDYRYLEGNVVDNKLMLSTFDGNHAFLFIAQKSGDSIKGDYYTGKSAHETWAGIKNENAKMPDAEALTYLKPGYEKLEFSFPNLNKENVSLTDKRFKNKVVILQIFGTWCPNCMDETKFLSKWYNENKSRGVEIVGLAYERKKDFDYAKGRIEKMKKKLDVPYDFLVAGINDKDSASKTLPALSQVLAFPTTIFVGKDGKVKHIRTGFEGPGTGIYHDQFRERFNQIINEMLKEEITQGK